MLSCVIIFTSCKNKITNAEVGAAMKHYDALIMKVDADSIALLYAEDGDLGTVAHGRDSIRNFLLNFKNVQVLSQESQTNSVVVAGDSAVQKGTYKQTAVINNKDTVHVKGEYTACWVRDDKNTLHIKRMMTNPIK